MSINHFSRDLPESLWWAHHHQQSFMEPNSNTSSSTTNQHTDSSWPPPPPPPPHLHHQERSSWLNPYHTHQPEPQHQMFSTQNPSLPFNLNHEDTDMDYQDPSDERPEEQVDDKEAMFEKPLTPSDVGKLNRLVIPKQHAEKYFPLGGDSIDKGLLLSFEDELGKCWRFRYSYWNSSQSYVLTKGWSRYVKEKQLDAGDVVLFERHRLDGERLFIGWRRRGEAAPSTTTTSSSSSCNSGMMVQGSGGGIWSRGLYSQQHSQTYQLGHGHGANLTTRVPYQPDCLHAGSVGVQNQTIPIGNSKRLRLFGVNLECQLDHESEPSTPDGSSLSSQGGAFQQHQFYTSHSPSNSTTQSHMDITFSRDVNQMRNRRG